MNPLISRACTKGHLKFNIKCDSLEVVNPLIEIPNAAPVKMALLLYKTVIVNFQTSTTVQVFFVNKG